MRKKFFETEDVEKQKRKIKTKIQHSFQYFCILSLASFVYKKIDLKVFNLGQIDKVVENLSKQKISAKNCDFSGEIIRNCQNESNKEFEYILT